MWDGCGALASFCVPVMGEAGKGQSECRLCQFLVWNSALLSKEVDCVAGEERFSALSVGKTVRSEWCPSCWESELEQKNRDQG